MASESMSCPVDYSIVDVVELEDLMLPAYTLGTRLTSVWSHYIDYMNKVILDGHSRYQEFQNVSDDEIISRVGGYAPFPKDLEEARKMFVELTLRLAEMPLNSEDNVRAHDLTSGISWARGCVLSYMGIDLDKDVQIEVSIDEVLGAPTS